MNDQLEKVPDRCHDPRREDLRSDVRLYDWCGRGLLRGGLAPCTLCEWRSLCPEYSDKPGDRPAGGRED